MKIIQVPFCFRPDRIGGTEVYVATLAADLIGLGVEVCIAAPGSENQSYEIDGLAVRRFAISDQIGDPAELYGVGDEYAAIQFARILDEEKPDAVHLHAFTRAVSLKLIGICRARNIPVIFTYHTPTVSCQRGSLMLWGEEPCDGKLDATRCTGCTLNGLGLPRPIAEFASHVPLAFQERLAQRKLHGGIWTVARMGELVRRRHAAFRQLMSDVDHIVAVCPWVRDVLLANDAPPDKISVCMHGIEWRSGECSNERRADLRVSDVVKIAFVGRIDVLKGIHVLIDALRALPRLRIALDIFGAPQSDANWTYQSELVRRAAGDERITFKGPIPSHEVVRRLEGYDFLAVPSQWMETGPLVILEAFAAGIPVLGERIGGIADLVQDEVNGLLIDPAGTSWRDAFQRIAVDTTIRQRLKAGVAPPRRSIDVAHDMLALYARHVRSPKIDAVAMGS